MAAISLLLLSAALQEPCAGPQYESGNAFQVPQTNLSVMVPDGWWLNTSIYSSAPSLFFEMPHPCEGSYPAGPDLEIELLAGDRAIDSLDEALSDALTPRSEDESFLLAPRRMRLGEFEAVEYVVVTTIIIDLVGGRGEARKRILHSITARVDDAFYRCTLLATEDQYQEHKSAPAELCSTIRRRENARIHGATVD